ncbi:undecaprenyl-phosphate glucose phosphotransferase [Polaribacter sejongensis]|uniref:Exopolysaccharide biosynthesis polyprenyl glycosylphosphotransferase n=1 Tax=Polaribacter sejongensis TaxID=985043 RepID=A0AAJ1VHM3_9FLAO|nr:MULTISPECIES: exopolysaccharide biosynthesis polyprenyl glycosylphosphotransferase [Polaribacter]AUC21316.1 undecaprenyl-phosphate glucose phosphotransferase [Polaribacter sejongensis]MDN3620968.1 exopolysaccharide biosynthesis polyprenyl glycosylphosphotransferase [Polaribacter undariae]UWD31101.1 exopolysaccharide biosynthesis polyprenyl glycosylphosphotransferase [Polaribacter undariae]
MKKKRSILIKPLIVVIDLILIISIIYFVSDKEYFNLSFISYITAFWLFISYYTKYYNVYRYTHVGRLVTLLLSQFFIFSLAYLSYFSVFKEGEIVNKQFLVFALIFCTVSSTKFLIFYVLKKYRSKGRNYRNIVLFGELGSARKLENLFHHKNDLGYRFFGFFSDKVYKSKNYLGALDKGFSYIINNKIDEVYCDPSKVNSGRLIEITKFVEKNELELRILPENKAIYSKDFILEYFGTIPILKPKSLPFEKIETHVIKRVFDILFSFVVCFFMLSWMLPILWVVIKLDSKGTFFFKQKRDGLDGKQFYCYKLRSMRVNSNADKVSACKNDKRITRVGAFLRKTSLDELPQFFNVLLGDMSIVGPRPHINVQTEKYTNEVENYLIRNSIKPGITGLAQVSGYRGEVIKKSDIDNRVRLDIFYIENWSFFLDIKIIAQTCFNFFIKEEKAY